MSSHCKRGQKKKAPRPGLPGCPARHAVQPMWEAGGGAGVRGALQPTPSQWHWYGGGQDRSVGQRGVDGTKGSWMGGGVETPTSPPPSPEAAREQTGTRREGAGILGGGSGSRFWPESGERQRSKYVLPAHTNVLAEGDAEPVVTLKVRWKEERAGWAGDPYNAPRLPSPSRVFPFQVAVSPLPLCP